MLMGQGAQIRRGCGGDASTEAGGFGGLSPQHAEISDFQYKIDKNKIRIPKIENLLFIRFNALCTFPQNLPPSEYIFLVGDS